VAKGNVTIDETYCKGCSLCLGVCPQDILELDMKRLNPKGYHPAKCVDESKCTACANCAVMCPDSAITVERLDS